ncbi:2-methylisocitrate lyase-like PEP mutase family enzyme [Phyllobacterium ifriqiyense]
MRFFAGIATSDQLDQMAKQLRGPFILDGGTDAISDVEYLASRKVRVALRGHHAFMATIQASYSALLRLHRGAHPRGLDGQPNAPFVEDALIKYPLEHS